MNITEITTDCIKDSAVPIMDLANDSDIAIIMDDGAPVALYIPLQKAPKSSMKKLAKETVAYVRRQIEVWG